MSPTSPVKQRGADSDFRPSRRGPVDLRLTVAAVAAWSGVVTVWVAGPVAAAVVGGACAVLLGWIVITGTRVSSRTGSRGKPVLGFALICLVAGTATGLLSHDARSIPAELLDQRSALTLRITSGSKPVAAQQSWQADRVRVHADVLAVPGWELDTPALVFADESWSDLPIGAIVSADGRIKSGQRRLATAPLIAVYGPARIIAPPGPLQAMMNPLRAGLRGAMAQRDPAGASLVAGLAIGDESDQSPELAEAMQLSGLSHLTAVSGGNTAIVLIVVLGLMRIVPSPMWLQAAVGALALAAYVVLVGPQPSVLRASAMGAVVLIGMGRGGLVSGLPVLALAALLLLLLDPTLALSLGFLLSVSATAGLLLLTPSVARFIAWFPGAGRGPRWLGEALSVTLAAQIATAPLLLMVGNQVSLAAVPANLVVAPLVAPVTIAGLLAALVAPFLPALAVVIAWPATVAGSWIATVADIAARWDAVSLGAGVPVWPALVFLALLGLVIAGRRRDRLSLRGFGVGREPRLRRPGLVSPGQSIPARRPPGRRARVVRASVLLLGLTGWLLIALRGPDVPDDWRVIACDVGQGSATLLRSGSRVILVDAGPEDGGVRSCLQAAGVERLDAVFITHRHADHTDGLAELTGRTAVPTLFLPPVPADPRATRELVRDTGVGNPQFLSSGQRVELPDLTGTVLWPRPDAAEANSGPNNGSLVIWFRWSDGFTALITGDIEAEAQKAVMASNQRPGSVDVVTVPHHGSANLDPGFAEWVSPAAALISVGADNDYGHPNPRSINAYTRAGAEVIRTDESGSVAVSPRGQGILVQPF